MTKKTKLLIIIILSVLAFFNAFYLSYDWLFSVKDASSLYVQNGGATTGGSFCDINDTLSCTAVLSNPLSQIYGIPFPIFAMFVYPIILIIGLLGYFGQISNSFRLLLAMGIGGIMFNGYFIYQETFNIGAFCPLCLLCTGIILTIVGISATEAKKECLESKKIKK